jgi:hypothetical protein
MPALDRSTEETLSAYANQVRSALRDECIGVVLYGSAAGTDWVPGRSDLNTTIVLRQVSIAALDALAPVLARWRTKGLALPVILDEAQVEAAQLLFPMELDDIKRQHRVLAGADPFATSATDEAALRRECAQEAFGKLLRLRASYVEHAADPAGLARMMGESVKNFLIVVRHLLRLRGVAAPLEYGSTLAAGEAVVGRLPGMRAALAHREGAKESGQVRELAAEYVGEAERLVAAVAAYCA